MNNNHQKIEFLARVFYRRRHSSTPDVEAEWLKFKARNGQDEPRSTARWKLVAAAAVGAAAMWCGMVVYQRLQSGAQADRSMPLVVLQHQDEVGQVIFRSGSRTKTLAGLDSLSFRAAALHAGHGSPADVASTTSNPSVHTPLQRIQTPRGMSFKVILEDGTEIWLNAESRIEFPEKFTAQARKVKLDGEAYFKVARNTKVPFVVVGSQMNVRVLGTEFNIRQYAHEQPHVALVKGAVEILNSHTGKTEATLSPDQEAWCDPQGVVRVRQADTYAVRQWVEGMFYFDDAPLVNILKELGRWYNLGVVFKDARHQNFRLHFSALRSADVRQGIEDLNLLCKFKIVVQGSNIVVY